MAPPTALNDQLARIHDTGVRELATALLADANAAPRAPIRRHEGELRGGAGTSHRQPHGAQECRPRYSEPLPLPEGGLARQLRAADYQASRKHLLPEA